MDNIFGTVETPDALERFGGVEEGAIGVFINAIINLMIIGAGVYAVINLVLAGYAFMSAGDDPKAVAGAWAKIWQTLLGLAVAAGAFVLAAIFSRILFGDYTTLLQPTLNLGN